MQERNTKQKKIIYQGLMQLGHPTATELYTYLHLKYPTISRATVFRVLAQGAKTGSIRKLDFSNGEDRFDGNLLPHYHVYCRICGKVSDVVMQPLDNLSDLILDSKGFLIESHDIKFTGICYECQKNK